MEEEWALVRRRGRVERAEVGPTTFEAVTRTQLEALRDEVAEIKRRVNGLLWTVVAAIVIDLVRALLA